MMKKKGCTATVKSALLFGMFTLFFCGTAGAHASAKDITSVSSTLSDQHGLSVTVYNVGLGLVKDIRTIQLHKGKNELRFMDVASEIIPASVYIRSLKDEGSLQVLEQNYEYDLLNAQKLLDKYVGKQVKLLTKNYYTEREEVVEATVLSNNGTPIFRIGDEITYGHPGRIIFPGVPDDLIANPTLVWLLSNGLPAAQEIEASYLTNGISWKADYVVTLNKDDAAASLSGWVTIDNKSGAAYKNSRLKLVAGDVNRVRDEHVYKRGVTKYAMEEARASSPQFQEEAFFEYHIYTLQRPSTIKNNQTKQISLVSADGIPVKKELIYQGAGYYYRSQYGTLGANQKVGVFIEILNKKDHNLGIPLPKGTVRVYKNDNEGSLQFVGENVIDHTPKDEKIRIKLGEAFDVVGSRKQMSWKKFAYDTYEASFELSLRNHKKEDAQVKIIEPVPGDWKMVKHSHPFEKTDSSTAEFLINVPRDEEVKVTYTVMMKF